MLTYTADPPDCHSNHMQLVHSDTQMFLQDHGATRLHIKPTQGYLKVHVV